jgi:hypothetical protein
MIGKFIEQPGYDQETDNLRHEVVHVETERPRDLLERILGISRQKNVQMVHNKIIKGNAGAGLSPRAWTLLTFRQVNGEEHDAFREGGAQNGLNQDRSRGAGIASHRFRSFHADETYTDRRAERCQTDMNVSSHFCQHGH